MTRRMKFDNNNAEHLHAGWRWETIREQLLRQSGRSGEAMDAEAAARNHWHRYQDITGGQG